MTQGQYLTFFAAPLPRRNLPPPSPNVWRWEVPLAKLAELFTLSLCVLSVSMMPSHLLDRTKCERRLTGNLEPRSQFSQTLAQVVDDLIAVRDIHGGQLCRLV